MTKKERLILEALQDSKHNLNQIKISLGKTESHETELIQLLKSEYEIEYQEYLKWCTEARKVIGYYNLDNPKYHKIKTLLPKPKRDSFEIDNYMM